MGDFIRRLVSGPKARFTDPALKLELDLVYITPRIIIMGYPAAGFEGLYRNRREDAKKFLDSRHGKDYWVFNLCPLRENGYGKDVFEGRVTRFPFPDHHAPPLALLPLVAREMHAWLDGAPDRVVVIHCKAGKGRSGTVACSYLLTLTDGPNCPLSGGHGAATTAAGRMHEAVNQIPAELGDEETQKPSTTSASRSHKFPDFRDLTGADLESDTKPLYDESGPPIVASPTSLSLESEATVTATGAAARISTRSSSVNPERSFTDALKGVLDLHTSKRMKPSVSSGNPGSNSASQSVAASAGADGDGKKQKQGVSIPSQRRWLYYWALILGGEEPRDVFKNLGPNAPDPATKPLVRITSITVRMRELKGVKINIVRAANAVLDKAVEYKNKRKAKPEDSPNPSSSDSPSAAPDTQASFAQGPNKLWASIARYDDALVEFLEDWEGKTRFMGCSSPIHSKQALADQKQPGTESLSDLDGELKLLFDDHGKWDKEKMVKSFAKFGVVGTAKVEGDGKKAKEDDGDVVKAYTLKLVSDKRKTQVKGEERVKDGAEEGMTTGGDAETPQIQVVPEEVSTGSKTGVVEGTEEDTGSTYSGTTEASRLTTVDGHGNTIDPTTAKAELEREGLVVEASREVRVKLYVGRVFIGWMWFIPTFHMPQPPTGPSASAADIEKSKATLHLTRKDIDFPLGLGTAIIDVDIAMEWVVPPSNVADRTAAAAVLARTRVTGTLSSLDSDMGVGSKVGQAIAGGLAGETGESGAGVVGMREAVEIGQATGV